MIEIQREAPLAADVRRLLSEHLAEMFATSPAESVHALDAEALSRPGISFWTARENGALLGCVALTDLSSGHGEIKSMRTALNARGRGIAATLLAHVVDHARRDGYENISLETGTEDYFAAARRLYSRHGFVECDPFADYVLDPNSIYMSLGLGGKVRPA
ncbi:GCN5 family acetyltransferase [Cryobacterium sp. MLB-32]|uniref:GNAT family N-acetyltransferase n=1 Tax=Cryobacterium sp. MLB-32 TaxID=1529318 RepID=UPI0004E6B67B|nr:GNAT family N-acetyltransferase [Cryobacterium sp. MLB-32]KFF58842.1 GCN5 family acetyltransferase [Cryobacterium sp. MLB-32]